MHYVLAALCIPAAAYLSLQTMRAHTNVYVDFSIYYAVAFFVMHSPWALYQQTGYVHFYEALKHIHLSKEAFLGYMATPPAALLLGPLSFLNYTHAYLVWTALNLILALLLAREVGKLAELAGLREIKTFLTSCVFGLSVTYHIFLIGQEALFTTLFFACFLRAAWEGGTVRAAIWCIAMLQFKPTVFLPAIAYILGCRHWKLAALITLGCDLLFIGSQLFFGDAIWGDYLHLLGQAQDQKLVFDYTSMVNLRALIMAALPSAKAYSRQICLIVYLLFNGVCFFWPLIMKHRFCVRNLCLLMPAGLFLCPYLYIHDTLLLLPICVLITASLAPLGKAGWMVMIYLLANCVAGQGQELLSQWEYRAILLILIGITAYLAAKSNALNNLRDY